MIEQSTISINIDVTDVKTAIDDLNSLAGAARNAKDAIDALKIGGGSRRSKIQVYNVSTGEKINFGGG